MYTQHTPEEMKAIRANAAEAVKTMSKKELYELATSAACENPMIIIITPSRP